MSGALRTQLLAQQPLPPVVEREESQTALAVAETAWQLAVGLPIRRPSPARLRILRIHVAAALRAGQPPDQWPLHLLRASGWIVLDRPRHDQTSADEVLCQRGASPLDDPPLLASYLAAMVRRGGVSGGRILLHSYLRLYPSDRPCLEPLRTTLVRLLTHGESAAAHARRATLCHGLLAPNGPIILARHLLRMPPGLALATNGLTGELAQGRFVEAVWEYLAAQVASAHASEDGFDTALRVLLTLSLDSGAKLRFPQRIHDLAESVLIPWTGQAPVLPVGIRNLLCQHLGDPRETSTAWEEQVSEDARKVIRQYLAGEVLEDFFTLLEAMSHRDPAIDRYRYQRRALWASCHVQGVLTDAWIAIGPSVPSDTLRGLGARARRYAELGTPTGARARQVILLLRIAGVTVVEWSHSGPYYLWHPTNTDAPPCYQAQYSYASLERNADLIRPHYEDKRGDWRADFLHHLATMTGISVPLPASTV